MEPLSTVLLRAQALPRAQVGPPTSWRVQAAAEPSRTSSSSRAPAGGGWPALCAGAAASVAFSRAQQPRGHAARAARAPTVVDVDVIDVEEAEVQDAGSVAEDLVSRIRAQFDSLVPVRSQKMEYVRDPKSSGWAATEISELHEGGSAAVEKLLEALRARDIRPDHADVAAAILCIMAGALDEAHNLVTPHTQGEPTHYGGDPRPDSEAAEEARICQVIIHRMEGDTRGIHGVGFRYSDLWVARSAINPTLQEEHPVCTAMRESAQAWGSTVCPDMAKGFLRATTTRWSPQKFNTLCADALDMEDAELLEFCGRLQALELRLLLDRVLAAGKRRIHARTTSGGNFGPGAMPEVVTEKKDAPEARPDPGSPGAGAKSASGSSTPNATDPDIKKRLEDAAKNPELLKTLAENDPQFKNMLEQDPMLKKVIFEQPEALGKVLEAMAGGGGVMGQKDDLDGLSEEDQAAIERLRLCDLSRPRDIIAQVYFSAGKNEELAADILLGRS